jgi:LysM repeat protein
MLLIILLVLLSIGVIVFFIYVDHIKKKKAQIKREAEHELASHLIDKIYADFNLNSNKNKLIYSYYKATYIFNDGTYIKLIVDYNYNFRFIYQCDMRYDFYINDDIGVKFKRILHDINDYITYNKYKSDDYYTKKSTKSNINSKDIKKYNKLVKIFKLRKKQLSSMNQNDKNYQSLKNEYLVLVDKLTELKKKL